MKIITALVFAGATLAFCGCTSADGPIFSNEATKTQSANANPSVEEQSRDIQNYEANNNMNMGQGVNGAQNAPAQAGNQMNPYGH